MRKIRSKRPLFKNDVEFIITLLGSEGMNMAEIRRKAKISYASVQSYVDKLKSKNLITRERLPSETKIKLTEKGEEVAKRLEEVLRVVQ